MVNETSFNPADPFQRTGSLNCYEFAAGEGVLWTGPANPSFNPEQEEGPGNWTTLPFTEGYGRVSNAAGWYTWISIQ